MSTRSASADFRCADQRQRKSASDDQAGRRTRNNLKFLVHGQLADANADQLDPTEQTRSDTTKLPRRGSQCWRAGRTLLRHSSHACAVAAAHDYFVTVTELARVIRCRSSPPVKPLPTRKMQCPGRFGRPGRCRLYAVGAVNRQPFTGLTNVTTCEFEMLIVRCEICALFVPALPPMAVKVLPDTATTIST